ncbi:MAG: ribonuclease P protein component [Acidobacteria bacterium]|nr:ribonuclease P protein component [Acidobacteriota bacterium]
MNAITPEGNANSPLQRKKGKFPRSARLLRHADFDRVYKQGKRHFAPHLTAFYLPRAEGQGFRVGLTVSRALGGAVDRNRIRRRLRDAIRQLMPLSQVGIDLVINPKKSLRTAAFSEVLRDLARTWDVVQQKVGSPASRKAVT